MKKNDDSLGAKIMRIVKKVTISVTTLAVWTVVVTGGSFLLGMGVGKLRMNKLENTGKIVVDKGIEKSISTTEEMTKGELVTENTVEEETTEVSEETTEEKGTVGVFDPKTEAITAMKSLNSMLITQIKVKGKKLERTVTQVNKASGRCYIVYMGYKGEEPFTDYQKVDASLCKVAAEYYADNEQEWVRKATGDWKEGHNYKDLSKKQRTFSKEFDGMFNELYEQYDPSYQTTDSGYVYTSETTEEDGTVVTRELTIAKESWRVLSYVEEKVSADGTIQKIMKNYMGFDLTNVEDMTAFTSGTESTEQSGE
jgi:hypothetical protein